MLEARVKPSETCLQDSFMVLGEAEEPEEQRYQRMKEKQDLLCSAAKDAPSQGCKKESVLRCSTFHS